MASLATMGGGSSGCRGFKRDGQRTGLKMTSELFVFMLSAFTRGKR